MGPENGFDPNSFTLFLGDTPLARGEIQLAEITVPTDAPKPERILQLQQVEFTVHFKTPKRWRCQSRKRFIKLMMSEWISRNYAERLAGFVRGWMLSAPVIKCKKTPRKKCSLVAEVKGKR